MCPARFHGEALIVMEIFRSPFSADPPCDSSKSYVQGGYTSWEVVQLERRSMAVKYTIKFI